MLACPCNVSCGAPQGCVTSPTDTTQFSQGPRHVLRRQRITSYRIPRSIQKYDKVINNGRNRFNQQLLEHMENQNKCNTIYFRPPRSYENYPIKHQCRCKRSQGQWKMLGTSNYVHHQDITNTQKTHENNKTPATLNKLNNLYDLLPLQIKTHLVQAYLE